MKTNRMWMNLSSAIALYGLCTLTHGAEPSIIGAEMLPDGGVKFRWTSESDKIYRIDYATTLTQPMSWRTLYTDYPSQGTVTFWKDVGNPLVLPPVSHPQEGSTRFYRVLETGQNEASKPAITITSPAEGATVSGTIGVEVSTSSVLPIEHLRLFADGGHAALRFSAGAPFSLNTCEQPNGQRSLHVAVRNAEGYETTDEASGYVENVTASALRTVTFDNYISQFRVSARVLNPAESETAKFVAKFAAYSDWTLEIKDSSDAVVRTRARTTF